MVSTAGVQPIEFPLENPYLLLEAINDIVGYLSLEIEIVDGYGFFSRNNDIPKDTKSLEEFQRLNNSILISGLLEHLDNKQYTKFKSQFDDLIQKITKTIEMKSKYYNLEKTHTVSVFEDDHGDIEILFLKTKFQSPQKTIARS